MVRLAITSQFTHHGAVGLERGENLIGDGGVGELAIDVEDVFPGAAVDGTGFDFGEVGSLLGDFLEGGDERAGTVGDGKGEAELVRVGNGLIAGLVSAAEQEETGVVFGVVFDVGGEDFGSIFASRVAAGDGGGCAVAGFDEMLDAAGGVIEGAGAEGGVGGEKAAALSERDGVGVDGGDLVERNAGQGDEVVADAQEGFGEDDEIVLEQEVEVLDDGAGETVFDGDDGGIDAALGKRGEDVGGERAGDDGGVGDETGGGFVAEGADFTLYGYERPGYS